MSRMWMISLGLVFGLLSFSTSETSTVVKSRGCSYVGVFHVEGRDRYSLTFEEAKSLCEHLSASLAQLEQVDKAFKAGLQTCRYGWTEGTQVLILRHTPHKSCAANQTGIVISEAKKSDALCYDARDLSVNNCSLAFESKNKSEDPDSPYTEVQPNADWNDHENSTSEVTLLSDTTVSESTAVIINNNSTVPINASPSSMENNETYQTGLEENHENTKESISLTPYTDATGIGVVTQTSGVNSDWLIILLVVLAVLTILLVCAVVAARKSICSKKQTLIITKSHSKGNDTSTSLTGQQEMVTLMNTEKTSVNNSEFISISLHESAEKIQQP